MLKANSLSLLLTACLFAFPLYGEEAVLTADLQSEVIEQSPSSGTFVDAPHIVDGAVLYDDNACCQPCNVAPRFTPCRPYIPCQPCLWNTRFYGRVEYLLWGMKDTPQPVPLIVAGPIVPNLTPVLGLPGYTVVLGGKDIDNGWRSGVRATLGYWFDDCHESGTEVNYIYLAATLNSQTVSSSGLLGSSFLALPFFDAVTMLESSTRIALPGSFAGIATLNVENWMQGVEWNGLMRLPYYSECNLYGIFGFRFWNFVEKLTFITDSPDISNPLDIFFTEDRFWAYNNFFGGQLGIRGSSGLGCFVIDAAFKLALGATYGNVHIDGTLTTNEFNGFGEAEIFPAGYFALPTNNGNHHRTCFTVIPEVNVDIGYFFNEWACFKVGYDFLYVSQMYWAGDQIDRSLNISQSPAITGFASVTPVGVARPEPLFTTNSFWAQGLTIALEFYY